MSQITSYVVKVIGDLQVIEVTKHLLVEICQQRLEKVSNKDTTTVRSQSL